MKKKQNIGKIFEFILSVFVLNMLILGSIMSCGVSLFMMSMGMYMRYSVFSFIASYTAMVLFSSAYVKIIEKKI